MRGKNPANTTPFDPEITKTKRKNRKKKKLATTKTLGKSSSSDFLSTDKPLVGNRPPRRTLGDYAYQQGLKHYNNIVIPPFSNKVVELKPTLLSLIGSHPFVGMDHEDPYTHLSTFMELCNTMASLDLILIFLTFSSNKCWWRLLDVFLFWKTHLWLFTCTPVVG